MLLSVIARQVSVSSCIIVSWWLFSKSLQVKHFSSLLVSITLLLMINAPLSCPVYVLSRFVVSHYFLVLFVSVLVLYRVSLISVVIILLAWTSCIKLYSYSLIEKV